MPVEPHPAGDRVDGVVAADVLDEHQDLGAGVAVGRERAAVDRAGLLVDRLVQAHAVEQRVQRRRATAWRRPAAGRRRSRPSGRRTPCPGRSRWSWCASPSARRGRASPSGSVTDDRVRRPSRPAPRRCPRSRRRAAGCAGSRWRAPRARRPASSASGAPACRRRASADARRRSASRATAPVSSIASTSKVAGRAASVSSGRYGAAGACARTALTPSPRRRRRAASV